MYDGYKPLIKSKEDAMFGHIVGTMHETFIFYTIGVERRMPFQNELEEVVDMILRRAEEIRSKILLATSR